MRPILGAGFVLLALLASLHLVDVAGELAVYEACQEHGWQPCTRPAWTRGAVSGLGLFVTLLAVCGAGWLYVLSGKSRC